MSKKGFSPIIVILIVALLAVGSTGSYIYIKSQQFIRSNEKITTTTKTTPISISILTTSIDSGSKRVFVRCEKVNPSEPFIQQEGWYLFDYRNTDEAHPEGDIYFLQTYNCNDNENECAPICGTDGHSIINSCDSSVIFSSNSIISFTCLPGLNFGPLHVSDIEVDKSPGSCYTSCLVKGYKGGGYCDEWSPNIEYRIGCDGRLGGVDIGRTTDCRIVSSSSQKSGTISPDSEGREWKATCCCLEQEYRM